MSEYKTCTGCKSSLSLDSFSKHNGAKAAKSGLRARCKKCESISSNAYRKANLDKVRETKRKWESKNPEKKKQYDKTYAARHKEAIRLYHVEYNKANREKINNYRRNLPEYKKEQKRASDRAYGRNNRHLTKLSSARYRKNNPEKAAAAAKRFRQKNPELMALKTSKRRAIKAKNGIYQISKNEIKRLYEQPCSYCPSTEFIEIDHIIPITRGGTHSIGNLTSACRPCNASKGNKYLTEWRKWQKNQ